jgi:hypothetical protein
MKIEALTEHYQTRRKTALNRPRYLASLVVADPHGLGAERGFREGRAADIAKTDEQHGRFSGHVLRSSMVLERYDISDPRA